MNAHVSEYDKKAVKFGKDGEAGSTQKILPGWVERGGCAQWF